MKRILSIIAAVFAIVACAQKQTPDYDSMNFEELMENAAPEVIQDWYDCGTRISEDEIAEKGAEIAARKKLICIDLDGTVTNHKTPMTPEARAAMDRLMANPKIKVIMCGAGNVNRIWNQMDRYPIDIVGNYGMQEAKYIDGRLVEVRNDQCKADSTYFLERAQIVRERFGYTDYYGESVEFHPAGMVTLGLLGTKAPREEKIAFDPARSKRRAIYKEVCELFEGYTVYIGGSSSFDFTEKGYNKYDACMNYAHENGFKRDEVLFIGDDFGDGGGDSHIRLGGMDYIQIYDFRAFPEKVSFLFAK